MYKKIAVKQALLFRFEKIKVALGEQIDFPVQSQTILHIFYFLFNFIVLF